MFVWKKYVYEVYKERSFTKAAQNLYISQPSLSARIKKIEEIIGEPLFDRSTTPLQLTEVGKVYIEAAEEITQIEQRVENYINDLAGLKTGSLFSYRYDSEDELRRDIRAMNRVLVPRGLCLLPMRMDDGRALLYLYRPQALRRDLGDDLACRLLRQAGYPCDSCGRCVARLVQRLRTEEEFPHEVGLFLSYPPEDVQGFIDHRAMDFKCAGLWKVYGDQQRAQALFDRFRRCTQRYCALWQTGLRLEQLAVAV